MAQDSNHAENVLKHARAKRLIAFLPCHFCWAAPGSLWRRVWIIIEGAIRAQADRCEARIGPISGCSRPRVYFLDRAWANGMLV